ncbi:HAMP domain-containing sensor histidine kinase [Flavobacterium sp.]|uniref:sensor histidine kinase n=1 Tax=Flavobacterium sp. TaxID=239 RepID=UPI002601ED09|nr:HAMP domain-containing sensor histidine kinase [Flavobacterium sp.]
MIEINDVAKNVSRIFNSSLSLKLKYDKISELLSNVFEARTVSILLYDSKTDSLVCQGFYLNADKLYFENKKLELILKHINIFDFLKHKKIKNSDCGKLYSEFTKSNNLLKNIDENTFRSIYSQFEENIDLYNKFKQYIKEEDYKIDDTTISGNYYNELLTFDTTYNEKIELKKINKHDPIKRKSQKILFDKFNITIEDEGFYLGLPLYATERYFGIIRFIFPNEKPFILFDEIDNSYKLDSIYSERFNYLSQIISLQIETTHYLDGYKKLSNIYESIDSINNLNKSCEVICDVVNCYGSLIRFQDENSNEINIKGHSRTLKNYVNNIRSFEDSNHPEVSDFSITLVNLFKEDSNIVAVSFNTNSRQTINIHRIDDFGEIKSGEHPIELIEFRSRDYINMLNNLNIKQLAIVTIPNISSGYMTFTNTENRKFITSDIEMLILAVKGIGMEIKHIQDTQKINQQQLEIAQTDSMRNVVHQLGAPLNGISLHLSNIVYKRVPEEVVYDKMLYTYHMIRNSMRQLKRFQRILELDTQPIEIKSLKKISIPKFLINKSMEFQAITKGKGITIHVYPEDDIDDLYFTIEEELFDEVVSILIDNAAKYAFSQRELLLNSIKFDELNRKTDGNILISFKLIEGDLQIKFTNWGATISPNEKDKIFNKHYRGENANKFSPIGSGIGLFLAKKIMMALKSKIDVQSSSNKTTFILTLKKVK